MESPYKEIIFLLLGGGLLGAIIAAARFISEQVKEKRKERDEKTKLELSETAELKRLESEHGDKVNAHLWGIIQANETKINKLEEKLEQSEKMDSLNRPVVLALRKAAKTVGLQIEIIVTLIAKEAGYQDLMKEAELLEQNYNELENKLP